MRTRTFTSTDAGTTSATLTSTAHVTASRCWRSRRFPGANTSRSSGARHCTGSSHAGEQNHATIMAQCSGTKVAPTMPAAHAAISPSATSTTAYCQSGASAGGASLRSPKST